MQELVPGFTDSASIAFCDAAGLLAGCEDPEWGYIEHIMPEEDRLNLAYAARPASCEIRNMRVILGALGALWKKSVGRNA